ncbi:MAG TPA: secondary thiamine-phosphate synthase enzyme YjbQ [Anaerolineae bacterium]
MSWHQTTFRLPAFKRGFHLITHLIEEQISEIRAFEIGLAHVFLHHTSAGLTLNENADPTVRADFESHFNHLVPENAPYFRHIYEGPDDMPAHIKASLLGSSVTVPITAGRLNLGTWQGIYLCEHRNHASGRKITVTIQGEQIVRV